MFRIRCRACARSSYFFMEACMQKQQNTFTEGKILSPLVRFTFPILLALILQAMYGSVDLLVVGQFGDATSISAVATGSTIMQMITIVISGFTTGVTILIGRHVGAGKPESAGKTVGASILLFSAMAVAITAILLLFARPLALLLKAPADALEQTIQYLLICGSGTICIIGYNLISSIFRGVGDAKLPLLFVAIACLVNIAGDLLLTGVLGMDVAGVAIATVLAQAVSVVLSLVIIRKRKLPFAFQPSFIRFNKQYTLPILKLGWPIALQNGLTELSFLAVSALINGMGLVYSAGYGVSQKIVQFIMLVPSAFMQTVSAFTAQNIGALQLERAKRGTFYSMFLSLAMGAVMTAVGYFGGSFLSGFFSNDAAVIAQSADYIKGFALDCLLTGSLFCFIGYFTGCGKTTFVMIQGLCGAFLVRFPLSYLFSRMEGASLVHMGVAAPAATFVSVLMCLAYFFYLQRRDKRFLRLQNATNEA